ncbi:hypothetical protein PINS_up015059 [Pythium insidiosum]|nr:hypothetical protein PINS_up015059 [Pythium insidiosum]
MMIAGVGHRSLLRAARSVAHGQRPAWLHLGRATPEATAAYLDAQPSASLRVGADDQTVAVGALGVGSPSLWAKDVPRIDGSKHVISSRQGNFLQASINPYVEPLSQSDEKQSYVESLVLEELIEGDGISREAVVVSAVLEDSYLRPALIAPEERLSKAFVEKGTQLALNELDVEILDHLVVRVPDELVGSSQLSTLQDALSRATEALEGLCSSGKIRSFGFALPINAMAERDLETLVRRTLQPLSTSNRGLASLQLPMAIGGSALPLPAPLNDLKDAAGLCIVADKVFATSLSNGKPFALRTYTPHLGEDVALLLKSAFNLAISIERKYMETILPNHSHLKLPTAEDVAWAHILANQHAQFDNLEEWNYIRETQIQPRFELTVREFDPYEELKEFGFAYSMAIRELLKCFTASVELVDASRAENLTTALKDAKLLVGGEQSLEHLAIHAALSGGADIVLVEEQLGKQSLSKMDASMSRAQVEEIGRIVHPHLQVE